MSRFKKIILSRKGFDSSAGGGWSPFDPQTGKYIVLPIPERKKDLEDGQPLRFEKIKIMNNYFEGCDASNLKTLMERGKYGWPPIIKGDKKEPPEESECAHFDPWLGSCPWLSADSDHNIGAFGQVGTAQAHLNKQEVEKDSLFLFFSRFRPFYEARESKCGFSPDQLNGGLYFIYGWLRVGWKPIQKFEDIDNIDILNEKEKEELKRHPHATEGYFKKYEKKEKGKNTIYIANKYLFDNCTEFSGCGYFPKLTDRLLLTATDSAQRPCSNWIPSRWSLPGFFDKYENRPSYLKDRKWIMSEDDSCLVETSGRGQEFVFSESEDLYQWLNKLFGEMHKENHKNKW